MNSAFENENAFIPDIRVNSVNHSMLKLEKPWSYCVDVDKVILLYILLEGTAWLHTPDNPPTKILPGTVVAFTRPQVHYWTTSSEEVKQSALKKPTFTDQTSIDLFDFNKLGDNEAESPLFYIGISPDTVNLVPDIIAPLVIIPVEERKNIPGLWSLLSMLSRQDIRDMDVGEIIGKRLVEALIALLTTYSLRKTSPFMAQQAACNDHRIRRVLSALHAELDKNWSLEELAQLATMSRSGLSDRFRQLVGDTPINYLNRLRMQRATSLLRSSTMPINQIAWVVGYQSGPAFNKAFVKKMGMAPGTYREKSRSGNIDVIEKDK